MNRTPETRWSLRLDSWDALAAARRALAAGLAKGMWTPHEAAAGRERLREAGRRLAERN
jgi:hypothetical protein